MSKRIDLTGKRFGKLVAMGYAGKGKDGNALWNCKCDCGQEKIIDGHSLRAGRTKSCGCLQAQIASSMRKEQNAKPGMMHRESRGRLYIIWSNMKNRTCNTAAKDFPNYGGRGITLCEEWKEFLGFKAWAIVNGYKDGLTIERKDNNGGYCPENCVWATKEEQNNNKRQSRKYTYRGRTQTIELWAKEYNINRSTLVKRLNKGMQIGEALETPVRGGIGKGYRPHKRKKTD